MKQTETKALSLEDLTKPIGESKDPAYLAWRDEQVRAALARADAHPEKSIPERTMWEKFGLQY